ERVPEAVREQRARDALVDELIGAAAADAELAQRDREQAVRVVVEVLVRHARFDAADDLLLQRLHVREQLAEALRGGARAADVRARDVAAVTEELRARVDEQ